MTGVDILSVEQVAIEYTYNWTSFWIGTGIIFLIFFIFGVVDSLHYNSLDVLWQYVIPGTALSLLFGAMMGWTCETPIKYTNEYKVTISDEVSMNDFIAKYEIIDQEGKIYTVRERAEQ